MPNTVFLPSTDIKVFPSSYREAQYTDARFMTEENFTSLAKITDDKYRNFAFQENDNVVVHIHGYRFVIDSQSLYDALQPSNDNWSCYLYIQLLTPEVDTTENKENYNTYGQILLNLSSPNNFTSLTSLDIEDKFYGLGITASADGLSEDTCIKLDFTTSWADGAIIGHTLNNKFLTISSENVRNKDTNFNISEKLSTKSLELFNESNQKISFELNGVGEDASSFALDLNVVDDADNPTPVGKLGFSGGEIQIHRNADYNHTELLLSNVGSSQVVSAGLTGSRGNSTSSANIIYPSDSGGYVAYLSLPKEPDIADDNKYIWIKEKTDNGVKNSWETFDSITSSLSNTVNDNLKNQLDAMKTVVYGTIDNSAIQSIIKDPGKATSGALKAINDVKASLNADIYGDGADKDTGIDDLKSGVIFDLKQSMNNAAEAVFAEFRSEAASKFNRFTSKLNALNDVLSNVEKAKIEFIKAAYPVSSIFMSTKADDPNVQLGIPDSDNVTWSKINSGYYLQASSVDSDDVKYDGKDYIRLTSNDIPKHRHQQLCAGTNGIIEKEVVLKTNTDVNNAMSREATLNQLNFTYELSAGRIYNDNTKSKLYETSEYGSTKRRPRALLTSSNVTVTSDLKSTAVQTITEVKLPNNPLAAKINMWIRIS